MAFEVMHADDRLAEREAQRVRDRRADQQRTGEPRSLRVRDAVEVGELRVRLREHALARAERRVGCGRARRARARRRRTRRASRPASAARARAGRAPCRRRRGRSRRRTSRCRGHASRDYTSESQSHRSGVRWSISSGRMGHAVVTVMRLVTAHPNGGFDGGNHIRVARARPRCRSSSTIAAAAPRAWVSATLGIDTGICTRPAPCRTFTYAITKVDAGGEVNVLDSGGYGEMTITKSVTVNVASGVTAGIVAAVADAVTINAGPRRDHPARPDHFGDGESRRHQGDHVRSPPYRELSLNGSGPARTYSAGISATPSAARRCSSSTRSSATSTTESWSEERPTRRSSGHDRSAIRKASLPQSIRGRRSGRAYCPGNTEGITVYNSLTDRRRS